MTKKEKVRGKILDYVKTLFYVLIGNAVLALSIKLFLIPADLPTDGATGLALIVNHYTGMSISLFVLLFNIVMLILGWIVLGAKFALSTIVSTFAYPLMLEICERIFGDYVISDNRILMALCAALGMGLALGIVIRAGSSTGGMDIPPLVLNRLFRTSVSGVMNLLGIIVLACQILYCTPEDMIYGALVILLYTLVLDKLLIAGNSRTQLIISSNHTEEIRERIMEDLDRGVTLLDAEGGYLREKKQLVLSVISNREFPRVEKMIKSIDPKAFIIINRVTEVSGRGFSLDKDDD
ncbi:MAG: YitT family protein [Firmicutes bacterium]|nr:YitT family protein [Bacillota bacterium]